MKPIMFNPMITVFTVMLLYIPVSVAHAQGDQDDQDGQYEKLEALQAENLIHISEIHEIADNYPDFDYSYDSKEEDVTVEGVDDARDRKRLEVLIFDIKENMDAMTDAPTRKGLYYSPEEKPEPKEGWENFFVQFQDELPAFYPENAVEWGVQGNVYVEFVVNPEGEINHLNARTDYLEALAPDALSIVEITGDDELYRYHIADMEQAAIDAVKETSGEWEPARVKGEPVHGVVVVPVKFRLNTDPSTAEVPVATFVPIP